MKDLFQKTTLFATTAVLLVILYLCIFTCAAFSMGYSTDLYQNLENIVVAKESLSQKRWNTLVQLNIFEDSSNFVLAPGSHGTYSFDISNDVNFPVVYDISIRDENVAKVPMLFRLKNADGNYVVGGQTEWADIAELQQIHGALDYAQSTSYTLDWAWQGDKDTQDTASGIAARQKALYILNFEILSEQNGAPIESTVEILPKVNNVAFWIATVSTVLLAGLAALIAFAVERKETKK